MPRNKLFNNKKTRKSPVDYAAFPPVITEPLLTEHDQMRKALQDKLREVAELVGICLKQYGEHSPEFKKVWKEHARLSNVLADYLREDIQDQKSTYVPPKK
jgi:hypothetical protein